MVALLVTASACSGAREVSKPGCGKDTDCKDPRVCERGVCVDPRLAANDAGASDADRVSTTPVKGSPAYAMFGGDARHTGRRAGPAPQTAPKELWKVPVGGDVAGGPTIGPDGTIYVGGDGIHAVWPDGTLRWKLATPEHVASTPALGADGTVYAGSQDDALYAVTPDGTKKWEVRTGNDVDASPTIGADHTIYAGSDDKYL